MNIYFTPRSLGSALILLVLLGCDDFVKVDPPKTGLIRSTVFASDATAEAAMIDVYYQISIGFGYGDANSLGFYNALSSDEIIYQGPSGQADYSQFSDNALKANNPALSSLWENVYTVIYRANAIIEGLNSSSGVTEPTKNQLIGEAKFIRALCYFYLSNCWGDVPLVLTTDYRLNNSKTRSSLTEVNKQIIADLTDAKGLLKNDYSYSSGLRVRANQGAATALLARVYLYGQDWANAELQASEVINTTTLYSLESDLNVVFGVSSKEAILQLWSQDYPGDFNAYFIDEDSGPAAGVMRDEFLAGFEDGDNRVATWVGSIQYGEDTYNSVLKYKSYAIPPDDYSTVLRLAEQYLIRAEARAHLNKLSESQEDINLIRSRALLPDTPATTQSDLLDAVMQERRSELFTEWGHRWLDLKRTGRVDAVLSDFKPDWSATDALYPIPESQIINNPSITQNPQ